MPIELAFKLPMYGQADGTPFAQVIELAQHAESAGYSTVYAIDHLSLPTPNIVGKSTANPDRPYFLDAWMSLAAVAAATKTIKIGPQVTPIGLRHPVFVAKWGATVDRISNGRLKLGLGLGHREWEYLKHGFPFPPFKERYAAMIEGIEIIRRLWTEEAPVTYSGTHYQVDEVNFWPKPVQQRVPFWFGGASPAIQRVVASHGDGWFPAAPQQGGFGPAGAGFYRDSLAAIRQSAASQGRTDRIGSGALFMVAISEDREDIERAAELLRRRTEYAGLSLAEINQKAAYLMGTPDEITRMLEPYVEAGVEELTISFQPLDDTEGMHRGIDLFARKVQPRFA